jgi:RNA recognition motif-containing protein
MTDAITLHVGNLTADTTGDQLKEYFSKFGEVLAVRTVITQTGQSRGFAFVDFATNESAENAIKDGQCQLGGNRLTVVMARRKFDVDGPPRRDPPRRDDRRRDDYYGRRSYDDYYDRRPYDDYYDRDRRGYREPSPPYRERGRGYRDDYEPRRSRDDPYDRRP